MGSNAEPPVADLARHGRVPLASAGEIEMEKAFLARAAVGAAVRLRPALLADDRKDQVHRALRETLDAAYSLEIDDPDVLVCDPTGSQADADHDA